MKVLVSAYACEPGKGSEAGEGWNWVTQISGPHQVWALTRANNRGPIEKELCDERLANIHWVYFDLPAWMRFWKKKQRGMRLYYYLWQVGAYLLARKLHRRIRFDLVHHLTFKSYWSPSMLAFLATPFLWGPVGGGESAPHEFWRSFSIRGRVYEAARTLGRGWARFDPFVRFTARKATQALATTDATQDRLRTLGCKNISVFVLGLPSDDIHRLSAICPREGSPFRIFSIGNLLHLKGFELGLGAFAELQRQFPASEYWLIGDGPERKRLDLLATQLGVRNKVRFYGALSRTQVLEQLAECDVLLHPSLHDSAGWTCLEAMAAGRPVVCLDLGGPGLQVTKNTGIKVPAISPAQVVHDLAAALSQLASDPELRLQLGQAARQRVVEHFNWDKKCELMMGIYKRVLETAGHPGV